MAGGQGTAIGSGFARGLANVLVGKRQRDQEEAFAREHRNTQIKMSFLPHLIENAESLDDVMPFMEEIISGGSQGRSGKKDPQMQEMQGLVAQVLQPHFDQKAQGQPAGSDADPTAFVRDAVAGTATQATSQTPQRRKMFGVELLDPEEKEERDTARAVSRAKAVETGKLDAQTEAKLAMAERLRSIDPSMSVEDSLIAVGLKVPQDQFGVVPTGGGVFNKKTGSITEPPSAKVEKLTGALGERTRELMAMDPSLDEPAARAKAAQLLESEREADRTAKAAAASDIATNRAFQSALLKLQTSAGGLTPSQALSEGDRLREGWQKKVEPIVARREQVAKVDSALEALNKGNRLAAVDQILVAFQKLNDEKTGVREGEVQRIINGLGLPAKIQGAITQLQQNGARIPDDELRGLAQLAKDTAASMDRARMGELSAYRRAITESIAGYPTIKPSTIFGDSVVGLPFQATVDGQVFGFDSKAKLDEFKKRFPNAK